MTSADQNREVVRAYVAAFNAGDIEALRPLFTPDAVIYGVLGGGPFDTAAAIWRELHEAFGLTLEIVDMVAEGDVVAVRYLDRGTSRGAFRGQEPTGKSYETVAMEWFVFREGKIHRRWGARDSAAQARQMGLKAL